MTYRSIKPRIQCALNVQRFNRHMMDLKMIKLIVVTYYVIMLSTSCYAKPTISKNTNIGILCFPTSHSKEQPTTLVRIGFSKGKKWELIREEAIPSDGKWDVAFDGKNLGQIDTVINKSNLSSNQRSHLVTTKLDRIRKFDNSHKIYSTWNGYDRFRPLVLVSNGKISDPEMWKPSNNESSVLKAKNLFLKNVGTISICDKNTFKVREKLKLNLNHVKFVKAYKNLQNEYLVGLQLVDYWLTTNCDGIAPGEFQVHWYYLHNKTIKLIGNEIMPVDAGDYDGDGRSEWIFQISRYNEDGYGLYSLTNLNFLEFTWKYH